MGSNCSRRDYSSLMNLEINIPISSLWGPRRTPTALICPVCLTLWCKLPHPNHWKQWKVHTVECSDCAYSHSNWYDWWRTEASIIDTIDFWWLLSYTKDSLQQILDTLPPNIIKLELQSHLKAYDYFQEKLDDNTNS